MTDKWAMDSTKLMYHPDRLKDFMDGKKIMPIMIDAGIHKGCNIRCRYCYGVKQGKSAEFIPEDRLMLLAYDIYLMGVKAIAIIGDGEPTMNPGLYSFVRRLHQFGIKAAVSTNGLLLDEEKIDTLTSNLTWMRFNISAVENYSYVMGAAPGSFEKLEKIVKYTVANKRDCTIGLQSVLIPDGFDDILPLAHKAVEWGVDYLVVKQYADGGDGMPMHFDMDDYHRAQEALLLAEGLSTDKTQIIVKWQAMEDSKNITKHRKWEFKRCLDLPFLFQMSGNGDCYPCGYLFGDKNYCYGNICKERLKDILLSDRYWGIIKKIADTPLENLCTGQCRHTQTNKFIHKLMNPPNYVDFV